MAFNEQLAYRIREQLKFYSEDFDEKRMFGGLAFLYQGKMTVGIIKQDLFVRVLGEKMEEVLINDFARPMDFTKRVMKESVYISKDGYRTEEQLLQWIELGLEHVKSKL